LPHEIVHRPKRGFTLPFERWMREDLRAEIEPGLHAKRIGDGPLGGLLDAKQVQRVWEDFLRGAVSWTRPWSLYALQRWCELHL
jgi:asparagine synthase (glutamine-hydrolysing)